MCGNKSERPEFLVKSSNFLSWSKIALGGIDAYQKHKSPNFLERSWLSEIFGLRNSKKVKSTSV